MEHVGRHGISPSANGFEGGQYVPKADLGNAPVRMKRGYSIRSEEAVNTLHQIEELIRDLKLEAEAAEAIINNPPEDGPPSELRNKLAQLHGDAYKIMSTRIDAILTGELLRL